MTTLTRAQTLIHYQAVLRDARRDAAIREANMSKPIPTAVELRQTPNGWLTADPVSYYCCHCKQGFEAEDAIKDTNEEGVLDLCPFCNSEDLLDNNDYKDPENAL